MKIRFRACFEQRVPNIQPTIEWGFTLTRVRDMTRTYSRIRNCQNESLALYELQVSLFPLDYEFEI